MVTNPFLWNDTNGTSQPQLNKAKNKKILGDIYFSWYRIPPVTAGSACRAPAVLLILRTSLLPDPLFPDLLIFLYFFLNLLSTQPSEPRGRFTFPLPPPWHQFRACRKASGTNRDLFSDLFDLGDQLLANHNLSLFRFYKSDPKSQKLTRYPQSDRLWVVVWIPLSIVFLYFLQKRFTRLPNLKAKVYKQVMFFQNTFFLRLYADLYENDLFGDPFKIQWAPESDPKSSKWHQIAQQRSRQSKLYWYMFATWFSEL